MIIVKGLFRETPEYKEYLAVFNDAVNEWWTMQDDPKIMCNVAIAAFKLSRLIKEEHDYIGLPKYIIPYKYTITDAVIDAMNATDNDNVKKIQSLLDETNKLDLLSRMLYEELKQCGKI